MRFAFPPYDDYGDRFGSGSVGNTRLKIRKFNTNAPRKPSAIPIWIGPAQAAPFSGTSDGHTSALRSSQNPSSEIVATPPRITGVRFGRSPSNTQNGVTQQPAHATSDSFTYGNSSSCQSITFQLSWRNCGPRRAWKNCVSSGRLPYQITMY